MLFVLADMPKNISEAQLLKASSPMLVTLFGMSIDVKDEQL
jgi:hypothetical protein